MRLYHLEWLHTYIYIHFPLLTISLSVAHFIFLPHFSFSWAEKVLLHSAAAPLYELCMKLLLLGSSQSPGYHLHNVIVIFNGSYTRTSTEIRTGIIYSTSKPFLCSSTVVSKTAIFTLFTATPTVYQALATLMLLYGRINSLLVLVLW